MTTPSKQEFGHTQTVDDAIALVNDAVIKETSGDEHIIRLKGDMLSGFGGSMDIVREKTEGVANIKGNMARQIIGGLLSAAFKMGSAPLLSRVSQLEQERCDLQEQILLRSPSNVERDNQQIMAINNNLLAKVSQLESDCRMKDEALRPFADYGDHLASQEGMLPETHLLTAPRGIDHIRKKHFVAARAAISHAPQPDGEGKS